MKNLPVLLASLVALSSLVACADKEGDVFEDTSVDTEAEVLDADLDGFDSVESGGTDCDDANSDINPSKFDIVDDDVDNDCDGEVDGFRYNAVVKFQDNGEISHLSHFTSGVPEGTKFRLTLFLPAIDYANWEKDPNWEYTFRENGFFSDAVITSDNDPETSDGQSDGFKPYFYEYPGIEDDVGHMSFVLCLDPKSGAGDRMMSDGSNCVIWGPTKTQTMANMMSIIERGGVAIFQNYKNGDPFGAPWESTFSSKSGWANEVTSAFILGFYDVPPVPESGM